MITVVLVALTAACVLLTVAFLATLRGVVGLRLRISGHGGGSRAFIDAGRALPVSLLSALPDPEEIALIAFVSDGCDACKELTAIVPTIPVSTVGCILGGDTGEIRGLLGSEVLVADSNITAAAARELRINSAPVVILQQGGRVVGSASGVSTQTASELELWWNQAQETIREKIS